MTNGISSNDGRISGSFVLTPVAGKKLIGMGVAVLPEVKHAYEKGRLAVANGTTTGYVIEALRGTPPKRYDYCVGVIAGSMFTENPDSDHTLLMWINGEEKVVPFSEFLTEVRQFGPEDCFIKGANAIDPYGYAGGLQTNPNGGSWADAHGLMTARGLHCIVPVGLEKMIPSVIEASKRMGQMRLTYSYGSPAGLIPLTTFKVVTEVEALKILTGVDAVPVAGGGIGGCEGSRAYAVEGTAEEVEKAFAVYKQVYDEPNITVDGKTEPLPYNPPPGW
ncbi:MAG: hypothetical protein JRJ85_27125 [Deltaproteobacteria bacterium]|nr:hypothetical protein [Deltaproteobacteria bacterium]